MSRKAAVAAIAAVMVAGGASIASARDDDGDGKTIRVTVRATGVALVENGRPEINLGDRFVSSGDVLRGGETIGVAGVDCLVLTYSASGSSYQCTFTASLPDGQLTFQSLVEASGPVPSSGTGAITGGTGRYRSAHGQATFTLTQGGLQGEVVYNLR